MVEVRQTVEFTSWLRGLDDQNAYVRVVARLRRMELGNPGDAKSVGAGVVEMRIDYGPGYRIYYTKRGAAIVILLCAGDKRTQKQDIKRAIEMVRDMAEKK
jgi:putative addiction module killer protein